MTPKERLVGGEGAGGVQLVDRLVLIFECLEKAGTELGIGELSRNTGMSKATLHRLLGALVQHRFVEQNSSTRQYRLGLRLIELGNVALSQVDLIGAALPSLHQLAEDTGETAHLAVLRDGMVLYVGKVEGWHSLRMPSAIGQRMPLYCTALGKVLLAHLSEQEQQEYLDGTPLKKKTRSTITNSDVFQSELMGVVQNGFAVDNEELETGLRCIAAPVRDYSDRVVAAISVSGPATRITVAQTSNFADQVVKAAMASSERLGRSSEES